MSAGQAVAVYGAYGYTGRFVVAELTARGFVPVLSGRDAAKLRGMGAVNPELEVRPATTDDSASLDRALSGVAAVINTAGPFAATAVPLIEAALRARIPYVDVAAEVDTVAEVFSRFTDPARAADVTVIPAMAFYGGLGDLLVTAAMRDWTAADEAHIAFGLDSWHPTPGTRNTIAVINRTNQGRLLRYSRGRLELHEADPPLLTWPFPAPMGEQKVVGEFNLTDVVTIPSHLSISEVRGYLPVAAVQDLGQPDTAPVPVDERGRSAQTFIVDVIVRSGGQERRAAARGQDAYAISAPLAVEAVRRVLAGDTAAGVASAGALFDAPDFLRALAPDLEIDLGY